MSLLNPVSLSSTITYRIKVSQTAFYQMLQLFLNKSLVVKSPVLSISSSILLVVITKTVVVQPVLFIMILNRTWTLRPSETVSLQILPHASYSAVYMASPFTLCAAIGVPRWSSW